VWQVREATARTIFTPTSGFLKEAGFTHSVTPARNCTYGCTYCYVPTMGMYGGLAREDVLKWGHFTTIKTNAAELVARGSTPHQILYCSPLVDPYQPAERERAQMPEVLSAFIANPPRILVIQTRGPLILRDLDLLRTLASVTTLRISFSITTDRDEVRRHYEPRCESNATRLEVIRALRSAGLEVYATLAPLLPCNPERLAEGALAASGRDLIGDPLHVRSAKPRGATTRAMAFRIAARYGDEDWFCPEFQEQTAAIIRRTAAQAGFDFSTGPAGFGWLARPPNPI
jgi:DNA repair photolyase